MERPHLVSLDKSKIQEYWPPATGYAEQSSARIATTKSVKKQQPIQPKISTAGPPLAKISAKDPASAPQQVKIEKQNPIIDNKLKLRLSSCL